MARLVAVPILLLVACVSGSGVTAQGKTSRTALGPLGNLVGAWNGTGVPYGTREEQQKGFWTETLSCEWQFKGDDAWLKLDFAKGKHYVSGVIRYVPDTDQFKVILKTTDKATHIFQGTLKDKVLTLLRRDEAAKEEQKLVVTLLHENRILYRYETKPEGKGLFYRKYQVGANKEGVPFALGDGRPECIVSGGLGTMAVSYMGNTYYVCCSGCRTEFLDNPKKYIDEYESKSKKGKK
jgi:hypothetical protein